MILDSSAIFSLVARETGWKDLALIVLNSRSNRISAANYVELAIVVSNRLGETGSKECDQLLRNSAVEIEPVTPVQAILARQAFLQFGKGRHKAALNFGDCFAYALSKDSGEPLLFVGNDFIHTDVVVAKAQE